MNEPLFVGVGNSGSANYKPINEKGDRTNAIQRTLDNPPSFSKLAESVGRVVLTPVVVAGAAAAVLVGSPLLVVGGAAFLGFTAVNKAHDGLKTKAQERGYTGESPIKDFCKDQACKVGGQIKNFFPQSTSKKDELSNNVYNAVFKEGGIKDSLNNPNLKSGLALNSSDENFVNSRLKGKIENLSTSELERLVHIGQKIDKRIEVYDKMDKLTEGSGNLDSIDIPLQAKEKLQSHINKITANPPKLLSLKESSEALAILDKCIEKKEIFAKLDVIGKHFLQQYKNDEQKNLKGVISHKTDSEGLFKFTEKVVNFHEKHKGAFVSEKTANNVNDLYDYYLAVKPNSDSTMGSFKYSDAAIGSNNSKIEKGLYLDQKERNELLKNNKVNPQLASGVDLKNAPRKVLTEINDYLHDIEVETSNQDLSNETHLYPNDVLDDSLEDEDAAIKAAEDSFEIMYAATLDEINALPDVETSNQDLSNETHLYPNDVLDDSLEDEDAAIKAAEDSFEIMYAATLDEINALPDNDSLVFVEFQQSDLDSLDEGKPSENDLKKQSYEELIDDFSELAGEDPQYGKKREPPNAESINFNRRTLSPAEQYAALHPEPVSVSSPRQTSWMPGSVPVNARAFNDFQKTQSRATRNENISTHSESLPPTAQPTSENVRSVERELLGENLDDYLTTLSNRSNQGEIGKEANVAPAKTEKSDKSAPLSVQPSVDDKLKSADTSGRKTSIGEEKVIDKNKRKNTLNQLKSLLKGAKKAEQMNAVQQYNSQILSTLNTDLKDLFTEFTVDQRNQFKEDFGDNFYALFAGTASSDDINQLEMVLNLALESLAEKEVNSKISTLSESFGKIPDNLTDLGFSQTEVKILNGNYYSSIEDRNKLLEKGQDILDKYTEENTEANNKLNDLAESFGEKLGELIEKNEFTTNDYMIFNDRNSSTLKEKNDLAIKAQGILDSSASVKNLTEDEVDRQLSVLIENFGDDIDILADVFTNIEYDILKGIKLDASYEDKLKAAKKAQDVFNSKKHI